MKKKTKKSVVVAQKMPKKNSSKAIWDLVLADIKERDKNGKEKYGVRLQAFNGRNSLVDAYQEVLDLVVYFRQSVEERKALVLLLNDILSSGHLLNTKLSARITQILTDIGEVE